MLYYPDNLTQKEAIIFCLRIGPVHLNDWLNSPLAAEYRARISELRRDRYVIKCDRKTKLYRLIAEPFQTVVEPSGQMAFV